MGNNHAKPYYYEQNTSKICLVCNTNKILNQDLILLHSQEDSFIYVNGEHRINIYLRCSKGHLLKHVGNETYARNCINEIINRNKNKENNDEEIIMLKNEINLLKKKIETFENINNTETIQKNIIPSAPVESNNVNDLNALNDQIVPIIEAKLIE